MSGSIFLSPSQTRLVTIIAHVDHGKTTLADNLIENNGLISERLAGTLRYLDFDPEEQRRGITMHASAIGLKHLYQGNNNHKKNPASATANHNKSTPMIVHLVDSPGHADFSVEVSSALLACDGALLVVDAVEGMGARTHQVLREAFLHELVPVLVINKIDRLCCDLCLTATEAYLRLRALIENVNAAASSMLTSAKHGKEISQQEEEAWAFDPARGNVIFASALYGWGFTLQSLARSLFRRKEVSIKPMLLKQYLFGDFKIKDEKVLKWKQGSEQVPLFAQYALQPIWDLYESVAGAASAAGLGSILFADERQSQATYTTDKESKITVNTPGMDAVLQNLQSGATGNDVPTNKDELEAILTKTGANTEETVLRALSRRYRPLADTVLDVICEYCPSPEAAAKSIRSRALALKHPMELTVNENFTAIQNAVLECNSSSDSPCVAYVCKFIATDRSNIRDPELTEGIGTTIMLGVCRVLSGRLKTDSEYYLLGPKHSSSDEKTTSKKPVRCYLLMGSSFVLVDQVPAGHLCALFNLEDVQMKTLTLCDSFFGMPLQGFDQLVRPLVKVNVEAENAEDSHVLELGLRKLSMADASVEVTVSAKGERILACLGELHLEQATLDLKRVYCSKPIELRISDPIVDFGETTDWFDNEIDFDTFFSNTSRPLRQSRIPPYNDEIGLQYAKHGRMRAVLSGRLAAISLRALPLVSLVHKSLQEGQVIEGNEEEFVKIGRALKLSDHNENLPPEQVLKVLTESLYSVSSSGNALVETPSLRHGSSVRGVVAENGEVFVPFNKPLSAVDTHGYDHEQDSLTSIKNAGVEEFEALQRWIRETGFQDNVDSSSKSQADQCAFAIWKDELKGSIVAGFQNALRSGPICEEPIRNVMFVLEGVEIAVQLDPNGDKDSMCGKPAKPLSSGMVVSTLREGIRCALLTRPARLMESHLKLTLHSSLAGLGTLYPVLSKRRGKVLEDTMVDGTDLLMITANIPQAEAFGLAPELFRTTSGEVTAPEMIFSHWERLDVDPFWIPTTDEEREDFGELMVAGDMSTGIDNPALKFIRQVRLRKGLPTDSARIIVAAEKQRTLKR